MSHAEDDPELRELVTEVLEKNGVLARVRAQLRAGVFVALDRENEPYPEGPVRRLVSSRDGLLALLLVQDMLEFCELRHAASVYRAETGQPSTFAYRGRDAIINDFELADCAADDLPLLVRIVSLFFLKVSPADDAKVRDEAVVADRSDDYDTTFTSYSASPSKLEDENVTEIGRDGSSVDDGRVESASSNESSVIKDAADFDSESSEVKTNSRVESENSTAINELSRRNRNDTSQYSNESAIEEVVPHEENGPSVVGEPKSEEVPAFRRSKDESNRFARKVHGVDRNRRVRNSANVNRDAKNSFGRRAEGAAGSAKSKNEDEDTSDGFSVRELILSNLKSFSNSSQSTDSDNGDGYTKKKLAADSAKILSHNKLNGTD